MDDPRTQKLVDLGSEPLAHALLELAAFSDPADDLVERLIATPNENVQIFKKKLSKLRHPKRFINYKESFRFANELSMLLDNLRAGVTDPLSGIALISEFYEADESIMESCDDSCGNVSDIFRYEAKELFAEYASRCTDKDNIADIILKLNSKDDFGLRSSLIDCAGEFLPEPVIRRVISALRMRADDEKDEYDKRHYLFLIESLARQIKDAKLFEETRIVSLGSLSAASLIDIGQVYLECGDVETAHSRLQKIPEDEFIHAYKRDQLLLVIYKKQGNTEKLTELLYQQFRSHRSEATLQALLDVMGNEKRDEVISNEAPLILESAELRMSDAQFLISIGMIDEAEDYLLKRADQFDGGFYDSLSSLAESMDSENRHLAASLIYRSLLISILEQGNTKAYPHGIRYLVKLDKLAAAISDWKNFKHHESFKRQIYRDHGRKYSFWSKYEGKKH